MIKKILYALLIGAGVGLTGTFLYINFKTPIKILGITLSLCMLISGMLLNYRSNLKK
ncbi:hypothetical protein ACQPUY_02480 [Clostridium nigeriense]|uniref:hypothetical protein n=1 Tax=Clostridium nigeriense TaxID=1805470 RepID=UPI003D342671